jgi:peptide chain release factor 1
MDKTRLYEKAAGVAAHVETLRAKSMDPEIAMDPKKYTQLARELKLHEPVFEIFQKLKTKNRELKDTQSLLSDSGTDADMKELAEQELEELSSVVQELEKKLELQLLPKDPLDEKNIIVELRAGAGGDEAALFVADLYRMYARFAEKFGWRQDLISANETGIGGYKELVFSVEGDQVYSRMKFESGVHRVQRIPSTESSGRIHTSTVTVAVLPEVEEFDFEINVSDVRVDTYCASGPGGQSVNTTYSAVRLTHLPTGAVVTCQDEKSQIKNRERAFKVLRARLAEIERQKQEAEYAANRSRQVGTGERAEKVRTYNFPQGRVSDHRIGLTLHNLPDILAGNMDTIIEHLIADEQRRKLESS